MSPSGRVPRRITQAPVERVRKASTSQRTTREPRRLNTGPNLVGDTITLYPDDGRTHVYCTVKTPNGIVMLIPVDGGMVKIKLEGTLAQAGRWIYRWGDGSEHDLDVLSSPEPRSQEEVDVSAIDSRTLPAMSVTRKPRF